MLECTLEVEGISSLNSKCFDINLETAVSRREDSDLSSFTQNLW